MNDTNELKFELNSLTDAQLVEIVQDKFINICELNDSKQHFASPDSLNYWYQFKQSMGRKILMATANGDRLSPRNRVSLLEIARKLGLGTLSSDESHAAVSLSSVFESPSREVSLSLDED